MNRNQLIDGFDLNDDLALDQQVEPKAAIHEIRLVPNRNLLLTFKLDTTFQ